MNYTLSILTEFDADAVHEVVTKRRTTFFVFARPSRNVSDLVGVAETFERVKACVRASVRLIDTERQELFVELMLQDRLVLVPQGAEGDGKLLIHSFYLREALR